MSAPRVLFLHANTEDYLADSLLHGLRLVLGELVVDVPRRDALYDDLPENRRGELYGRGFTLYARLQDPGPDRQRAMTRLDAGEFDVVVFADIHRNWAPWVALRPRAKALARAGVKLVAVDGHDLPFMYPYGPTWWKQMRPWPLPRAHGRIAFFKRELSPVTAWARTFGLVPPSIAERHLLREVQPIAFSIPEDRLATGEEPKTRLLATHVVDPEVQALVPGTHVRYAFDDEAAYYEDLRSSRYGVTTRKGGWETLRHYEIAASGTVPCFRNLGSKPGRSAPFGLVDGENCVAYASARELLARLERIGDEEYARLRSGALAWARANTTRERATDFLRRIGAAPGAA
jgi:hypothetical protein